MMQLIRFTRRTMLLGALALSMSGRALALGFRNPDQDARATGQGEAFVAQADSPSAVYYNPGGLTQVTGTEAAGGGYITFRDIRFSGASGSERLNDPAYTPHFYASSDCGTENFRIALGLNVPFGDMSDWGSNTSFKYLITKSSLAVKNYEPAVAYRFNEHLSLGVGLNVYDGETELQRLVPFTILLSAPKDGRFRFKGGGQAVGATVGALWTADEHNSVGVVYRSAFDIDFHGHAVVDNDPTSTLGRSPATAAIAFPQSVALGYAFRPNRKWKLEADVEWTNWDTLNTVRLHSPNPAFANDPTSRVAFNWQDSFYYEFGTQYLLDQHWTLRAGYIYSENTVPTNTFSPSVPDSNRHVFSIGAGFANKRLNIDVAYQYSYSENRNVVGTADNNFDGRGDADGLWKSEGHAIVLTSTMKF